MTAHAHCTALLRCAVILSAIGCNETPMAVRDTEGRSFQIDCRTATCRVERISGGGDQLRLESSAHVLGICEGGADDGPGRCRAVACEEDIDCPAMPGLGAWTCDARRCVDTTKGPSANDAVMLCLAGTGTGFASTVQRERYALALNCGDPCRIPRSCRAR